MECDKNKGKKLGTSVSYMQWCLHSFPIFPFFLFPLELFLFNPSCHMRSLYAYRIWFLYNKQLSIAIQCSQLRFSFIADFCCVCVFFLWKGSSSKTRASCFNADATSSWKSTRPLYETDHYKHIGFLDAWKRSRKGCGLSSAPRIRFLVRVSNLYQQINQSVSLG